MLKIDIDSLSEEQLIELNHRIVARLRFLNEMRSHSAMLDFRIGEKMKFHPDGGPEITGTLTHYNKKTVTVITREEWANAAISKIRKGRGRTRGPESHYIV